MKKKTFDELFALASTGKVKTWKIEVIENEFGYGNIWVSHGYVDGKIQSNCKCIKKGKNIGKVNETTPFEQACNEAESKWNSKKDQNYQTTIPEKGETLNSILPMLAIDFNKRSHNITYPAYVQPKLDGVRCFAIRQGDEIIYQSRNGKLYETLNHLTPTLLEMIHDGEIFDGEIYTHGWSFQRLVSAVKKENNDTKDLQFWVFDYADINIKYIERLNLLESRIDENNIVKLLNSYEVSSKVEIENYHDQFVKENYEGAIIRNIDGYYKFDFRSADLQKFKKFKDEEFVIAGFEEGTGLEEGCVIFVCVTEDGKQFRVRPQGSRELRKKWLQDSENIWGKQLTVRHQEPRSEDNIPRFPVGIEIRDYE